ncbi:uncharacterized protein LOC105216354 isoform X2 [Zeugodacus cucurbitae]|uniref:uncharacterized protein LOC105216354 isoform X2 n=1 Tax=Zeugodacus cucurbitae TaxID=28588 RepID=UPI0005969B16|nr:uncharacterized protein LOC105216354 isoform X2 [Zeugodacus cucurbitae]
MFSSINFLFLISLAVTTWIILCYFKQIEQQREDPMTVEVHMNNAFEETMRAKACFENYDIYLNFLAIFACIYALAKVATFAENYVAQQVHARFKLAKLPNARPVQPTTVEEFRNQHAQLNMQIDNLEKENAKLAQKVKHLEQSNFLLRVKQLKSGAATTSTVCMLADAGNIQMPQENNKTTSNGMLHAFGSNGAGNVVVGGVGVACNQKEVVNGDGAVEGKERNSGPCFAATGGVFCYRNVIIQDDHSQRTRQIWQKYLEMQKYAIQKPAASHCATEVANAVPIVVSTEELQTMQGTDQQRGKRQPQRTRHAILPPTSSSSKNSANLHTTPHTHTHIPQTSLTLPIQIYYKNLLICLLCWFY